MSVRANTTAIGAFVSGAIVLAVVAVLVFGSGALFRHQEQFIIYFADSVNGLSVGSPVKYKGVQIGQVSSVRISYDQPAENADVPVIVDIDVAHLRDDLGVNTDLADRDAFNQQINDGLRAKLQMQSLLTGLLYVDLDYYGESGTAPPKAIELHDTYKEIPSLPSGLSETMKSINTALQNIAAIDFPGLSDKADRLLDQLNAGLAQIDFKGLNDSLLATSNSLNAILSDPKLKDAIAQVDPTLKSLQTLSDNVNQQVQPLSNEIQLTAQRTRASLDQLDATLRALRDLVAPESSLRTEVDGALTQVSGAARSLRVLSDYLERNPSALLTGKAPPESAPEPAKK